MNKNKIILAALALVSVLAIALGFAAAFGKVFPAGHVKDQYDSLGSMSEPLKDAMSTVVSHTRFAWIGGIATGVLGILGLGAAGFAMFKGIELNQTTMIVALGAIVTLLALGIAAIVCQSQLNSATWMTEQMTAEVLKLMPKGH